MTNVLPDVAFVPDVEFTETCVRRLAELHGDLPLGDIIEVVTQCQRELVGEVPAAALPELVERLARVRLEDDVRSSARRADLS